jgi:superfamily II DNA or RNA helicase
MSGKDKTHDKKRVIISTWQSIYKMQQGYFDQFGAVIGDECHQFKAKSLTSIMTKLRDCPYRIGTTGTLDGSQCHKLVIEGLFGPVYKVTSTKKLMDKKLLTNLDIDCLLMSYPEHVRQQHKRMTYQEEIDWIVTNPERNEFITNLTSNLKGNTLVLFQFVEKHGKPLFEMIKERCPDRKCFFVYGGTDVDAREEVRRIAEEEDSAIIVASYGTFSTGISIRRLHNVVFSSPSKSRIRVLQSIGRQLRKSEHKEIAKLYDLGDDIHWKSYKNHTLRHFSERLKIYDAEGFNHKTIRIKLEGGSHE